MAIIINSLTPVSPSIPANTSVTFTVNATSTDDLPLTYLWEFSNNNGVTYSSQGLVANTSSSYTTSNLTQNQSGLYFRVRVSDGVSTVFSNEDPNIGNRIVVVTAAPQILLLLDYEPSYNVPVGTDLDLVVEATLANVDITNSSSLNNLSITWEYEALDGVGDFWQPVTTGITTTTFELGSTPQTYGKRSTLRISNIQFAQNLWLYRARITYTGASNTPIVVPNTVLYVNPILTIYKQPGESPDTQITNCYKTSIPNSGNATFSVGALTTANTTLNYRWQFTIDGGESWRTIDEPSELANYWYRIAPGTTANSDVLSLQRLIYFETFGVRCVISGTVGEIPVTSDAAYIYMTDVPEPISGFANVNIVEDRYGNIPNRDEFLYPPSFSVIGGAIDTARNTGLNGDITAQFQRQDPGTTTWYDVGEVITSPAIGSSTRYTQTPQTTPDPANPIDLEYQTAPLRRDVDNGAKYRIKITSTALFNLVNNQKVLVPYYSNEITLNVYRTAYIIDQPADSNVFPRNNASFGINAIPSSGTTITYKWQYSINGRTNWTDIPAGGSFFGQTTDLLIYNDVPKLPTYFYYRVIVSVPNQLSSVTSTAAALVIRRDRFTSISIINDAYISEYDSFSFTVNAQSLSLRPPTYQWQKSNSYNATSPTSAVWEDIPGKTSNVLSFSSASPTDTAFYRLKLTSAGEEVEYSNVAYLFVQALNISIIRNNPTTRTFLEGLENEYTFDVLASSSVGSDISYQWQIKRPGESTFSDIGVGFNGSLSTNPIYTPRPFERSENGSVIRCQLTSQGIPITYYTSECLITVNRRFSYFADAAVKTLPTGSPLVLDLNPTWTGGNPSFQWQVSTDGGSSWQNLQGETSSFYNVISITNAINNYQYRCLINLSDCSQHQYSRGGSNFIVSATSLTPTVSVTIAVTAGKSKPIYYTKQTEKTGAAIGTVICVAKPPDYVNNPSATTDDISQWQVAISGSITSSGDASSSISGTKPSWMDSSIDYKAPKWLRDRYPGYLELRGQWLLKSEFSALYSVIGDAYGSTSGPSGKFRLPNLYGKKLLGTGNVNNNSGAVSVIPLFAQDTSSGGDKNVPGSMGGVYNYIRSSQLPPGSPGLGSESDGTSTNTFALGSYTTTGFTESVNQLQPSFQGSFQYTVGPMVGSFVPSVPTHSHSAITVGWISSPTVVNTTCQGGSLSNPQFPGTEAAGGSIDIGPAGIAAEQRGSAHTHGVTINGTTPAGNGNDNHNDGKGSGGDEESDSELVSMQVDTGRPTAGMYMNPGEVGLTNQSRSLFNSGLAFYLRNNETMPIHAPYFRLKYLIKAY